MLRMNNRSARRLPSIVAPIALLGSLAALPACVTTVEGPTRRGIPLRPSASSATGTTATAPRDIPPTSPTSPAAAGSGTLPDGPVARPAADASTFDAQATVTILDLGMIPSDGQVLPLVSPDGRFVAAQYAQPPNWTILLASGDQRPAIGTRLAAYSVDPGAIAPKSAASPSLLSAVAWSTALPEGAVLGRSADNAGFLIESPRTDGSRWIAHVSWLSGDVRWLVRDTDVNSAAVLGPAGELAFSRRPIGANRRVVVARQPGSNVDLVLDDPSASLSFPCFSGEPGVVYVFASSASSLDLRAYALPKTAGSGAFTFLGGRELMNHPDEAAAFQACASIAVPAVRASRASAASEADQEFVFFHPGWGRMARFSYRTGAIRALPEGSMSAIAAPGARVGESGFIFTSEKSVRYVSVGASEASANSTPSRLETEGTKLLAGSLLVRQAMDKQWPYVLIGPGQTGGGSTYRILKMRLGGGN
ncbi:MAG: hypothetical protein AB7G11_16170 [Phycisphaerales bacterium]